MSRFQEAREKITGDSWLDDLARGSLLAAEAKFSGHPGQEGDGRQMSESEFRIEDVHGERTVALFRHLLDRAAERKWTWLTEDGKRIAAVVPLPQGENTATATKRKGLR